MRYRYTFKPVFDRLVAVTLIIVFSPIWLPGLGVIHLIQGGALFYMQSRSGFGMRKFKLYKIRTLEESNVSDLSLTNRDYTALGKWLRNTSIDELPQLINVVKGEMSLVGPRPMPVEYNDHYDEIHKKRFSCKPGITGLAQISGRNNISWEKRFELDNWYSDHISFLLDLKILSLTFKRMFDKTQQVEMPVFSGSKTL